MTRRKETPKVEPVHSGNTDMIRQLDKWSIVIKWVVKEARVIVLGLFSIFIAVGLFYNHDNTSKLQNAHVITQDQLNQIWHHIHVLESRLDADNDSVGFLCLTNSPAVATVSP